MKQKQAETRGQKQGDRFSVLKQGDRFSVLGKQGDRFSVLRNPWEHSGENCLRRKFNTLVGNCKKTRLGLLFIKRFVFD
ncbi:hypothetical protein UF75_2645 [Desulfosporosinus sp. I2]|nr:hypothetical protein UF75_2645 [Desulfosporosinus sp. I2]